MDTARSNGAEKLPQHSRSSRKTHQLFEGPIVVCDPDAPIEYGCRVFGDGSGALDGRCETKRPSKVTTGCIRASWRDVNGDASELGGWQVSGPERCVFRIVAELPPALPLARGHLRVPRDVPRPGLENKIHGGANA